MSTNNVFTHPQLFKGPMPNEAISFILAFCQTPGAFILYDDFWQFNAEVQDYVISRCNPDVLICPVIKDGNHWALLSANLQDGSMTYYDSDLENMNSMQGLEVIVQALTSLVSRVSAQFGGALVARGVSRWRAIFLLARSP